MWKTGNQESDKKRGPLETWKSRANGCTDPQKQVGVDRLHPQEACQQDHQTGCDLASTGEEEEKTQEHRAQRHGGGRNAEKQSLPKKPEKTAQGPYAPQGSRNLRK